MLHIVTPLFRYDLLDKVYQSIPKHTDIIWHIAKTTHRERLVHEFIYTDERIKLYEIDCLDSDIVAKRNTIFSNIKNGYFYLLDDDTIFLNELYLVYKTYSENGFIGMILGNNNFSKEKFLSIDPTHTHIDTGRVLCHTSVLQAIKWEWSLLYARDCLFWSKCYEFFGKDSLIYINKTIATYNYLGVYVKVKKKIFFLNLKYDIKNLNLAKIYFKLSILKIHTRNFFIFNKKAFKKLLSNPLN